MSRRKLAAYLYLIPCLVFVCLFIYYPVGYNIYMSLFNWNSLSFIRPYIGLKNYVALFHDPIFFASLRHNILYAVISVIFQIFGGLILAAILEDQVFRRISGFFRTVFFIPALISMTVIGLLFTFIYDPEHGMLNGFLQAVGLGHWATGWLGNSSTAMLAVIAVSQWQSIGYIAMLYVVAMQRIPHELYEAARLDGATKIDSFFHITIPQVREMSLVNMLVTVSGAFLVFNEVDVMTNGGPGHSSQVLSTYLYQNAFIYGNMGYAAAIANVMLIITVALGIVQIRSFRTGRG